MIKLSSVMTRGDVIRLIILLLVSAAAFLWLWLEWQQPIIPIGVA